MVDSSFFNHGLPATEHCQTAAPVLGEDQRFGSLPLRHLRSNVRARSGVTFSPLPLIGQGCIHATLPDVATGIEGLRQEHSAPSVKQQLAAKRGWLRSNFVTRRPDEREDHVQRTGNPGNVG
jgi:hypothetical protein